MLIANFFNLSFSRSIIFQNSLNTGNFIRSKLSSPMFQQEKCLLPQNILKPVATKKKKRKINKDKKYFLLIEKKLGTVLLQIIQGDYMEENGKI